jgi:hypothetical protein
MKKSKSIKLKTGWSRIFPDLERWVKDSGIYFSFYDKNFSLFFPGYHFAKAWGLNYGSYIYGFSVERSPKLAQQKAISELFEHILFSETPHAAHPSGVGIGYSSKTAKEKALQELLERDRFFNHYSTMLPFLRSKELDRLLRKSSYKDFEAQLNEIGIDMVAREMLPTKNHRFVIVNLFGHAYGVRRFGVITGLGSGLNLADALEHACCEARLILFGVVADQNFLVPRGDRFWIDDPYVSHVLFGRKIESGRIWRKVFMSSSNELLQIQGSWAPKVIAKVNTFSFLAGKRLLKIFFATTHSPMIQNAFWGRRNYKKNTPIPSVINWDAREKFIAEYEKRIKTEEPIFPSLPHFPHVCG